MIMFSELFLVLPNAILGKHSAQCFEPTSRQSGKPRQMADAAVVAEGNAEKLARECMVQYDHNPGVDCQNTNGLERECRHLFPTKGPSRRTENSMLSIT